MLQRLSIENIALIQRLDLEFTSGLTILSGETGAGKSILIDALALVLGARADSALIRTGAERATVTATFQPATEHPCRPWLQRQSLEENSPELILRRVLNRNGPSRAFINETQIPLSALSQLGDLLVEVHGQHDNQALLDPASHLAILDAFADHPELLATVTQHQEKWRRLRGELDALRQRARDAADRHAFLTFQLEELTGAGVTVGEMAELEGRRSRLAHATRLADGTREAWELLQESPRAAGAITGEATAILESIAELDPALLPIAESVRSLHYELEDAAQRCRHYMEGLETDPAQLETLEERLDLIRRLCRKHHREADQLPELEAQWRQEIDAIDHAGENERRLEENLRETLAAYEKAAKQLSVSRKKAAQRLTGAVEKQLGDLHMANTRFALTLKPRPGDPSPRGSEEAAFEVSANPGEPLKPLKQVASGGELSRITLALRVVLADRMILSTLIFDEVDVGVGGRVAAGIGSKLARVARGRQVLAITHLPQVAAWGENHLKVTKATIDDRPRITIDQLDDGQRQEELARMLAGNRVTAAARRNARELLDGARERNMAEK